MHEAAESDIKDVFWRYFAFVPIFLERVIDVKSTGIVRKVDDLGRIVLPIELRRTLDIGERDAIEIFVDNNQIILKKYCPACIFCGEASDVKEYKGKLICPQCLAELAAKQ